MVQQSAQQIQVGKEIYDIGKVREAEWNRILQNHQRENRRHFYLRLVLMIFVPLLGLVSAYLLYQY